MSDNKLDFNLDFLGDKTEKKSDDIKSDSNSKEERTMKSPSTSGVPYAMTNTKLIMLTILTLGLYEIYWFYKQWRYVKQAKDLNVTPWARGLFSPLFAYPLFKHIFELARKAGERHTPSAGWLAVAYFVLMMVGRAEGWVWMISLASFWPLLPVQSRVNMLWSKENPKGELKTHFSTKEVIVMIIGGIILVFALLGSSSETY
ncbi:MAG: hypothetical protein Q7K55_02520 [Candidatus Levybacteria bacterium]|nr:hypothetical protein [Candidatus Levybacteria bacterium]